MAIDSNPLDDAETLIAGGRSGDAAALLRDVLQAGRGGLLTRLALARALRLSGDTAGAIAAAREAAQLFPGIADAALALGEALLAAGKLPPAIAEIQRAIRLDPSLADAVLALGRAWLQAGEAEKALAEFAKLDAKDPDVAGAIAQAQALLAAPRSSANYVQHLFDQFSADYDARMLGQLGYRAPAILRGLADLVMGPRDNLAILDLGCGTGLAAIAFSGRAAHIDGVDLSPAMIEKARARGLYRHLAVADIETYLQSTIERYDLVLAADTLVYLGDLAATFAGARARLTAGGFFLFTVERGEGGFELGPKRRWRHSEDYLRNAAAAGGFDVAGFMHASPRSEAGVPVEGYAVALQSAPAEKVG